MAVVYQHRRVDNNEVFYVGIGKSEKRAYSKNRHAFWKRYVAKHPHYVEITHRDLIWEEAYSIEKYLIGFYGRMDLGLGTLVNLTDGGEGVENVVVTEEKKFKLSKVKKAQAHIYKTDEFRSKMSTVTKGENNPMHGRRHTEEAVEKMKNSWTEDRRSHYRAINSGELNPMFGKTLSDELKHKLSDMFSDHKNPRARAVLQYDINGNFIREYLTIKEANEAIGSTKVGSVCSGLRPQTRGFIFKYKTT